MARVDIPLENIYQLPLMHRATVDPSQIDAMGHMNVRHYLGTFDDASWGFFAQFGMTLEYYQQNNAGGFALRNVITYLAEVRVNETVAIYSRVLGHTTKKIHFMHFMVNETTERLAATFEALGAHADMTVRRTAPYPDWIGEKITAIAAEHQALPWDAPISGGIQL